MLDQTWTVSADRTPLGPANDDALGTRIERTRWLAVALLLDLGAWLSDRCGPVTDPAYRLSAGIASIPEPRHRLAAYVSSTQLGRWEQALAPWFRSGCQIDLEMRPEARVRVSGLGAPAGPTARMTFVSHAVVRRGASQRELDGRWTLRLSATADLESVR